MYFVAFFFVGKDLCRLNEEEVNIIRKIFKMNILHHKELRKRECDKAMDEYEELRSLSWKKNL